MSDSEKRPLTREDARRLTAKEIYERLLPETIEFLEASAVETRGRPVVGELRKEIVLEYIRIEPYFVIVLNTHFSLRKGHKNWETVMGGAQVGHAINKARLEQLVRIKEERPLTDEEREEVVDLRDKIGKAEIFWNQRATSLTKEELEENEEDLEEGEDEDTGEEWKK